MENTEGDRTETEPVDATVDGGGDLQGANMIDPDFTYPFCIDCKHYMTMAFPDNQFAKVGLCSALEGRASPIDGKLVGLCSALEGRASPIDGKPIVPSDAGLMRLAVCGLEGRLFVDKMGKQQ